MKPLETIVLIPSLHPDHLLTKYVEDLVNQGFEKIIVVDDGSGPKYEAVFGELKLHPQCLVIGYPVNYGKGHALKYGMTYISKHFPNVPGIVTADSDGQHTSRDVLKVAQSLQDHPNSLIIGSRDFSSKNVPLKSRAGNRMTSFFFALLYGKWLPDTQSGLRGFSMDTVPLLLDVPGERFEYEMNMLILASTRLVSFHIVLIQTIYIDDNRRTHFRPFKDSMRIYANLFKNFFKYTSASSASTLLDILLFTFLDKWLLPRLGVSADVRILWGVSLSVFIANALARISSSIFNFKANQSFVFQADKCKGAFPRYIVLAVLVLIISSTLISTLSTRIALDNTLLKILIDTFFFFVNYRLQRTWVFAEQNTKRL